MKLLKRILLGLLTVLVLAVVGVYVASEVKLGKTYEVNPAQLAASPASADPAHGRKQAEMRGCAFCHQGNFGGELFVDNFAFGRFAATNLTTGRGGIGPDYSDGDWVRAVRHGIDRQGKPLFIMPSHEYNGVSDTDLSTIIAYVRSLPPVDSVHPPRRLGPVARALVTFGQVPLSAAIIDHAARPVPPVPGVTVAYGGYLARMCMSCHGENLRGLPPGGHGPPPGPDITPRGTLANYTEQDFFRVFREGKTPSRPLDNERMPWKTFAQMTDDELRALWLYVQARDGDGA
ncbi:MAG: c-type cytochrome [Gemmatimonadaceae bacterium]